MDRSSRSFSSPVFDVTVHGSAVDRRRELLGDEREQPVDTDRLGGRATDHRSDTGVREPGLHADGDLFLGERAVLQVLLDQLVVRLRHGLHELLAGGICDRVELVGPFALLRDGTARVAVRFRVQEVGDARELGLRADRQLERRHLVPERRHELIERVLERRALAIQLVHEDRAGQPRFHRELPRRFRLHLDAVDRRDDDDHRIDRSDRGSEIADEVGVAGCVQDVDLDAVPFDGRHRERDRDALALLVRIVIGDRVAVLDGAHARDGAGCVQHGLQEGGLAGAAVADQQDVTDVLRVVGLQHALLQGRVRGILVKC